MQMCIGIMLSEGAEKPVFMRICGVYRERGERDIEAGFSRLYGRLSDGADECGSDSVDTDLNYFF